MAIFAPPINEGREPLLLLDEEMFASGFGGIRGPSLSFGLIPINFSFS